jgi:prepilin-type N-terminal cleavage/methylation domain-containing protein
MSRRAVSLIEMLVVIAVSGVVMGLAVTTLGTLMQAEQSGRNHVSHAAVLAQLADQFRADVHAAVHPIAVEAPAKDQWKLTLPKNTVVTYAALPDEIQRREQVDGKLVRRESYLLPAGSTAEIVLRADLAPAIASLVVSPPRATSPAGRELRVDAAWGVDHRFVKSPEGGP